MKTRQAMQIKLQYQRGEESHYIVETRDSVFGARVILRKGDDATSVIENLINRYEQGEEPTGLDILE